MNSNETLKSIREMFNFVGTPSEYDDLVKLIKLLDKQMLKGDVPSRWQKADSKLPSDEPYEYRTRSWTTKTISSETTFNGLTYAHDLIVCSSMAAAARQPIEPYYQDKLFVFDKEQKAAGLNKVYGIAFLGRNEEGKLVMALSSGIWNKPATYTLCEEV